MNFTLKSTKQAIKNCAFELAAQYEVIWALQRFLKWCTNLWIIVSAIIKLMQSTSMNDFLFREIRCFQF